MEYEWITSSMPKEDGREKKLKNRLNRKEKFDRHTLPWQIINQSDGDNITKMNNVKFVSIFFFFFNFYTI